MCCVCYGGGERERKGEKRVGERDNNIKEGDESSSYEVKERKNHGGSWEEDDEAVPKRRRPEKRRHDVTGQLPRQSNPSSLGFSLYRTLQLFSLDGSDSKEKGNE